MPTEHNCDVLIMGASLAGSCLARQLKLQQPDLSIIVVDQKTTFDHWVGESTVEAFTDYAMRVLRLGPYLERHHVQKHGLRFFFDTPDKSLSIPEMSEFGRTRTHELIAHQLDRSRFDKDMVDMNRELGIEVMLGTTVSIGSGDEGIAIDGTNGHRVQTSAGPISCRWLIDAGGLNSPLVRTLKLSTKDPSLVNSSYWGRYVGAKNIDDLGDKEWRARTGHYSTLRFSATNHFMYRGYWIWVIPLSDDSLSVGVCFDKSLAPDIRITSQEELDAFVRSHKGLEGLLEGSELVDFYGLKNLCRSSKQHFSTDRWALTGMSMGFLDPIHSTTCWQIAMQNRLIGAAITAERAGERDKFESQIHHYNLVARERYKLLRLTFGNFNAFGSFDYWTGLSGHRLASYFNSIVTGSMTDFQKLTDTANAHVGGCSCDVDILKSVNRQVVEATDKKGRELVALLDEAGQYNTNNVGKFEGMSHWEEAEDIVGKFGLPQDQEVEDTVSLRIYCDVTRQWSRRAAELRGIEFRDDLFDSMVTSIDPEQTLTNIVDAMAS